MSVNKNSTIELFRYSYTISYGICIYLLVIFFGSKSPNNSDLTTITIILKLLLLGA